MLFFKGMNKNEEPSFKSFLAEGIKNIAAAGK